MPKILDFDDFGIIHQINSIYYKYKFQFC